MCNSNKVSHVLVLNLYIFCSFFCFSLFFPGLCSEATSSCLSILLAPLEVLSFLPPSPFIRYSPPHLLSLSIPLLSTGICLGISRWKLRSISGAPYQHTIIMGNHAEHCWIQLGLPLWWHYWLQGPASAGAPHLHSYLHPFLLYPLLLITHLHSDMDWEMIKLSFFL